MNLEILEGLIEWALIIIPIIVSITSLTWGLKNRKKIIYMIIESILGCINFALSIYIPMCNFSYFYRANFIVSDKKGDLSYLINELSYNSNDAKIILTINLILFAATIINLIYFLKKEK